MQYRQVGACIWKESGIDLTAQMEPDDGADNSTSDAQDRRRQERERDLLDETSAALTLRDGSFSMMQDAASGSNVMATDDDYDDDADLQAAIRLSMMDPDGGSTKTKANTLRLEPYAASGTSSRASSHTTVPDEVVKQQGRREGHPPDHTVTPYSPLDFHKLMWDEHATTESDQARWVGQGINVVLPRTEESSVERDGPPPIAPIDQANSKRLERIARSHTPWGLQQQHGGPCGVLAAVQAEMLKLLLWSPDATTAVGRFPTEIPNVDDVKQESIPLGFLSTEVIRVQIARAIALIIARAALSPSAGTTGDDSMASSTGSGVVRLVLPKMETITAMNGLSWDQFAPWSDFGSGKGDSIVLELHTLTLSEGASGGSAKRQKTASDGHLVERNAHQVIPAAQAVALFLLRDDHKHFLSCFMQEGGVMLLVMSIVASRGASSILSEFDDANGTHLTAQFGHCSQELINLLLTGQAVSNVFDDTLSPSGDMICRGIQGTASIGYLTQVEALRYCEVGSYYKSPQFPIWVVGSTSHFSVLFGEARALNESESDELLEKCSRAFKSVDGGESNGFIPTEKLRTVLERMDLGYLDNSVEALAASLDIAGIVLWDDLWKVTSRLLTGASLESVLAGDDEIQILDEPPEMGAPRVQDDMAVKTTCETDEEMARRLAAEWDTANGFHPIALRPASPVQQRLDSMVGLSDEELARKLQAEWDAEDDGAGGSNDTVNALTYSPASELNEEEFKTEDDAKMKEEADIKSRGSPASVNDPPSKFEFELFGETFSLYHYNGLRGGVLTPLRVTRLSANEAVGASIGLNRTGFVSGTGDLEDVLRTKWPSCQIDWLGNSPPHID